MYNKIWLYTKANHYWFKCFCILLVCLFAAIFLHNLNPFNDYFFSFHDSTQASRIVEFSHELKTLNLIPKFSKNYFFGVGYPLFKFYAPASYYISSVINILGFNPSQSIKFSFALALVTSFVFMYKLTFSINKNKFGSLIAAILYATSPWLATEIFVRGNLAEIWFIALLPASIYFLITKTNTVLASLIIALALTSHNALSLVLFAIMATLAALSKNKNTVLKLLFGVGISSFFWIPFFADLHLTQATQIASITKYSDHFLCLQQLYKINWGYGGSAPGCVQDGMNFALGKLQVLLGFFGLLVFFIFYKQKSKADLVFLLVTLVAVCLTLDVSLPLWQSIKQLQSFQFPWRFISFVLFGVCYFSSYIFTLTRLKIKIYSFTLNPKVIAIFSTSLVLLVFGATSKTNSRYFIGLQITNQKAAELYSKKYINTYAVYSVPEYIASSIEYKKFISFWGQNLNSKDYKYFKVAMAPLLKQTLADKIGQVTASVSLVLCVAYFYVTQKKHHK